MCDEAYCPSERREVGCLNDLLQYVPAEFIVLRGGYTRDGESREEFIKRNRDFCLCPIDLPASFVGNGKWTIREDIPGACMWLIEPKPTPTGA